MVDLEVFIAPDCRGEERQIVRCAQVVVELVTFIKLSASSRIALHASAPIKLSTQAHLCRKRASEISVCLSFARLTNASMRAAGGFEEGRGFDETSERRRFDDEKKRQTLRICWALFDSGSSKNRRAMTEKLRALATSTGLN